MARKKGQEKDGKANHFDRILAVAAFIAGVVALYFSWQANQIANEANELSQQQITERVSVVSIARNGGVNVLNQQSDRVVGCDIDVVLANLGGASTQIIGLSGTVFLDGVEELSATSQQSSYASTASTLYQADSSPIRGGEFHALTSDGYSGQVLSEVFLDLEGRLNFPYQIDAFGSANITNRIILTADPQFSYRTDLITMPSGVQITSFDNNENRTPIAVTVTYELASGRTLTTPSQVCFFIDP